MLDADIAWCAGFLDGEGTFQWRMDGSGQIRATIPLLLPHLTVKRRAAEIVLAHAETFTHKGPRRIPVETLDRRIALEAEIKER